MRKAKGPMPQNRSATLFDLPSASITSRASVSSPSAVACRKPPGGSATLALPISSRGGTAVAITSPLTLSRASFRSRHEGGELGVFGLRELALGPHAHVEAGERRRHRHVAVGEPRADGAADVEGARHVGLENGAVCDVEQRVAARLHEARRHHAVRLAHMQAHAAAARAMRVDDGRSPHAASPRAFSCSATSEAFQAR